MAKKKLATTRGILSRMKSDSSNNSGKSCGDNNVEALSTINLDGSEDSRISTTRSFGSGSSRKSSFRFGRKKKSLAPGLSIIETNNEEQQVDTNEMMITTLTDYSIQTNTSEYVIDGSKRPPLLPPTMSTTPVKSKTTIQTQQQQPSSKFLKRTRSLTPSDIHYLNSTESTKFGSVPISQHYETNEQLLDLFTTLYEKGVNTDPSVVQNDAEGAGSMGTVSGNKQTSSSEEYSRVAYAAGVKFVEVALFTIPQHGYYKSNENDHQDKRAKSIVDAVKVTQLLGDLVDDEEDVEQERLGRLSNVAYKSLEEVVKDGKKLDKKKQGKEETSGHSNMDDVKSYLSRIWNDARDGGKILNQCVLPDDICSFLNICGGQRSMNYVVDDEEDVIDKSVKGLSIQHARKRHKNMPVSRPPVDDDGDVNMASDTMDEVDKYTPTVEKKTSSKPPLHTAPSSSSASVAQSSRVSMISSTPSILTESAVDEVSQVEKIKQAEQEPVTSSNAGFDCNSALQLALSLKGGDNDVNIVSSCESTIATDSPDKNSSSVVILSSLYQEQYNSLREKGVFHVRFLDTYQGRNPLSTNGCTVIGPLLCIHYFTCSEENRISSSSSIFSEDKLYWDSGIPDELINQVIDDHAASVLPVVRKNLNLGHDSFIIPSDVHDHLIEVGLLSTSSFVGVCGGNILDEQHLSSFKSTLLLLDDERERERLKGRKIGATLFFHAHVIAIHVINNGDDLWIEVIDSLPNPDTWINSCPNDVEMMDYEYSNEQIQNTIRVRLFDVEHFHTLILQYALTKFSEEEQQFIDNNEFDERNCESSFDPRVFQAFVWAEA